jgi:hypothetical protein
MVSAHSPAATEIPDWKWSPKEKAVARRAFDLALSRELEAIIKEAKHRAARVADPTELWDLERWLSERRREIDGNFQFRYSVLPLVFATLLRNGQLSEGDLHGLSPDKLDTIRRIARF